MARPDGQKIGCASRPDRSNRTRTSSEIRETAVPAARWNHRWSPRPFHAQGIFEEVKAIADTGLLVAFANRRDAHHDWAVSIAERVTEPLLTCEAVLAETAFHLGDSRLAMRFVGDGLVRLAFSAADHLSRLAELAERFADRAPDLADLCLIKLSELHPNYPVITTDVRDFQIYRRGRRERIPLICPP